MAQHGNRSERHEEQIRKSIDAKHLEYNIEEKDEHAARERFQEDSPFEKAAEKEHSAN